jgi:hypothetical protein
LGHNSNREGVCSLFIKWACHHLLLLLTGLFKPFELMQTPSKCFYMVDGLLLCCLSCDRSTYDG